MEQQTTEGQYSYTRGLRWKLKHTHGELPKPPETDATSLTQLVDLGMLLGNKLMFFIYMAERENPNKLLKDHSREYIISNHVRINKKWLKQFFQSDFYAAQKKAKEFTLCDFEYAVIGLKEWIDRWPELLSKLKEAQTANLSEKKRHSDIALLLYELKHKKNFPFIQGFAEYARHKTERSPLPELVKEFSDQLDKELTFYAPAQGAGLIVAAASLNYYTVGKKAKYSPEDETKQESEYKELKEQYDSMKQNKAAQKSLLFELMNEERIGGVENIQKRKDLLLFSKSEDKDCLEEVYDLTREIKHLTMDVNRACAEYGKRSPQARKVKSDLREAKQERGFYFIKKARNKKHEYLKGWWNYCEKYKKIAMDMGKAKAQLAGIKKERLEAEQLRYWALLRRKGEQTWLWCIPKEHCSEARTALKNHAAKASFSDQRLYCFHSITHRALHKLCFAEGSSFARDLPPHLRNMHSRAQKATNDPEKLEKERKKYPGARTKDELELTFYKALLADSSARQTLELSLFDFEVALGASNLKEFQMAFDTAGYYAEKLPMDDDFATKFTQQFKVLEFALTSYDLELRYKKDIPTKPSEPRRHTRLWEQFWQEENTQKPNVRINPELKIRLRKADEELRPYLEKLESRTGKQFNMNTIRHRNLQDQYTLHFTIELNAGRLHEETALAKADEIAAKIDEFNAHFNERNWENSWKYGIDRGQIELATLCLAQFHENDRYNYNGNTYLRPSFPEGEKDLKVYWLKREKYDEERISEMETLPRENRRPKRMISNLSYFMDKAECSKFFEKRNCTTIDLTTAKVIRGKIVGNGDVLTFLKLKYEAAKRILFDLVANGKNLKLEWGSEDCKNPAFVQLRYTNESAKTEKKKEELTVYFFEAKPYGRDLEGMKQGNNSNGRPYTRENIHRSLQKYVTDLLRERSEPSGLGNHHVPPISRINHLRDALVANMLGVISHLQQHYPGIVVLEDLKKDTINKHFQDLNIDISRPLERALYRKFQTLGQVPPHLKGVTQLREKIHADQEKRIDKEIEKWKSENPGVGRNKTDKAKWKIRKQAKEENKSIRAMQIGAIVYVDEYNTSKDCPYCGKKMDWGGEKIDDKKIHDILKYEQQRFSCGKNKSCGFDTDNFTGKKHEAPPLPPLPKPEPDFVPFHELNDPDKIAAYNVAKKVPHWQEIGSFAGALKKLHEEPSKEENKGDRY